MQIFVKKNYVDWIQNPADRPLMSPTCLRRRFSQCWINDEKVFFILIDKFPAGSMAGGKRIALLSILRLTRACIIAYRQPPRNMPATLYSPGLMPSQIEQMFPDCG